MYGTWKSVIAMPRERFNQRGVISPVLANWTLHRPGMSIGAGVVHSLEDVVHASVASTERKRKPFKIHVVRYADDFIITGATKAVLQHQVRPAIEAFLKERGLELSDEKTQITHISQGFDFLGQNVRKYTGTHHSGSQECETTALTTC